jgi:DNA-binding NarL/FixJ family response regulator
MLPVPAQLRSVAVSIHAADAISYAGIVRYFVIRGGVEVLPFERRGEADVVILSPGRLTQRRLVALRELARQCTQPAVLLVNTTDEADMLAAADSRGMAVLLRSAVSDEQLLRTTLAAVGKQVMSTDLIRELFTRIERFGAERLDSCRFEPADPSPREVEVLRLISKGKDTAEIARQLSYSERTVKNIFYHFANKHKLRNRSHAVAYAVRSGLI